MPKPWEKDWGAKPAATAKPWEQDWSAPEKKKAEKPATPAKVERAPDPTEGMSRGKLFAAGGGKSLVDNARGVRQFATELLAGPLAGVGALYGGLGRPDVQSTLNAPAREAARLRAEETQRQVQDAPLMQTGAGLAGNVTGNIVQMLAPGYLARGSGAASAFMPRTPIGNGVQGGLLGLIQPVGTDDSRATNAGIGLAVGGAASAIPGMIGYAGRTAKSIVEPFTAAGQERLVAQALQRSATDPARLAAAAPSAIPGVTRTLAEETADPGIAQLQRQFPQQLADQSAGNNAARSEAVRRAFEGADKSSIAGIRASRDAAADQVLAGLPSAPPANMAPVLQSIDAGIEKKVGFNAAQGALREFRANVPAEIRSAEEAYNVRKQIDFLLSKQSDKPAAQAAKAELLAAKRVLDDEMTKVYPQWGQYLSDYVGESRRMDQAKVGQTLLGLARQAADPNTSERSLGANAMSRAANDPDALVRGATRFNGSNAGNTLTKEQGSLLQMLGDDASRMDFAATGGRATGSDTANNLATRNILSTLAGGSKLANLALGSQPAQRLASLGEKTYGLLGVPDRLQSVMVEALSDPARARQILGRLPTADRSLVERALTQVSGRLAVGSVPALTK